MKKQVWFRDDQISLIRHFLENSKDKMNETVYNTT